MISRDELTGLAQLFSEKLRAALSEIDMLEAIRRNHAEGVDSMVCHTHDFCDANVYMGEAWEEFFGQAPDVSSDSDAAIWNEAWTIAKANAFYVNGEETFVPLADVDAWESWWRDNGEGVGAMHGLDKATAYKLACNCELVIGGGAAPLYRIGFVD